MEVKNLASEVSKIKSPNITAMDKNIEHLIASKDLASIVEATINIANKEVQAETKIFWFKAAIGEINDHVTTAENAAQAAARGQFDLAALQTIDAEDTARQVENFARTANLKPVGQR